MKQGFFITIEGIEGAGKSTAMEFLESQLQVAQIQYVKTREPGGTPIAEDIRTVLLNKHDEIMNPSTELLLMFAARAQNIAHVVLPALQRGQWVVADRFTDASYAYQGSGRGVPTQEINELATFVQGDLQPNLTLLLDVPVAVGFARLENRRVRDRIECEGMEFFERVRKRYLERAKKFPERFRVIDANKPLDRVRQQILDAISPVLQEHV